jgi:DNA-binding response OmpR family regulator
MTSNGLQRKRFLVVEDSFLVGETVCNYLADYGMEPVGPAPTVEEALMLIENGNLDAALLEIRLGDRETVFPVCEQLTGRHIPFAFVSGTMEELPERFKRTLFVAKPLKRADIPRIFRVLLKQT